MRANSPRASPRPGRGSCAAREHVERRPLLGEVDGIAQRQHQHHRAELDGARDAGQRGQGASSPPATCTRMPRREQQSGRSSPPSRSRGPRRAARYAPIASSFAVFGPSAKLGILSHSASSRSRELERGRLQALHAGAHHVLPRLGQRATRIDARVASSMTAASKPALRASSADHATQKSVASPTR